MSTFNLEIVAIDKVFYRGECEYLVFEGLDGEKGVMANHEPMISAVRAGELRYTVDGDVKEAAIGDGFAEILGDKVTLICDFAERPEDIDEMRAQRALERAQERIKAKTSEIEYIRSRAALARAMARLKVTNKMKNKK